MICVEVGYETAAALGSEQAVAAYLVERGMPIRRTDDGVWVQSAPGLFESAEDHFNRKTIYRWTPQPRSEVDGDIIDVEARVIDDTQTFATIKQLQHDQ